jgi:hypothetical protein
MERFFSALFQDPILLIASVVLVATVVILLWALKSLNLSHESSFDFDDDEETSQADNDHETQEDSGLEEARLQEITSQLMVIAKRMEELEKTISETKKFDRTLPDINNTVSKDELDKLLKRIESRLELLAADNKPSGDPAIDKQWQAKIETKLEGIHKLLVLLTDSGGTESK